MVSPTVEAEWHRQDQKDDLFKIIEKALGGASILVEAQKKSPTDPYVDVGRTASEGLAHNLRLFYENGMAYRDGQHHATTVAFITTLYKYSGVYTAKKARNRVQAVQAGAIAAGMVSLPFSEAISFVCMAFALTGSYITRFWQKLEDRMAYDQTPNPSLYDRKLLEEVMQEHASHIQQRLSKFPTLSIREYSIDLDLQDGRGKNQVLH